MGVENPIKLQRDASGKWPASHGAGRTSIYKTWQQMRYRCGNPDHPQYADYGGRGITVCDRWRSFESFREDMGERPIGMSIDRINNDGPYSPDNCRWATVREQSANKRSNTFLETRFGRLTLMETARASGIKRETLAMRSRNGLRGDDLLKPPNPARQWRNRRRDMGATGGSNEA